MGTSIVPTSRGEMIQWFEDRVPAWNAVPAVVGLTAAQITAITSRLTSARAAFDEFRANYEVARASTTNYYGMTDDLRQYGQELVHIIRAFGVATDNPNVFATAMVPPPAVPQSQGTPATPLEFSGFIDNNGEVQLSWASPTGGFGSNVFFTVQRRFVDKDGVVGSWQNLGSTGDRKLTDSAVPTGNTAVAYRVCATRNALASTFTDPVEILFGNVAASPEASSFSQPLALAA